MLSRRSLVVKKGVGALAILGATALIGAGVLFTGAPAAAETVFKVNVGGGGKGIAVEEFMPKSLTVHVGDTVQFANPYEEIHTVTYVKSGSPTPELIVPAGPPPAAGPPKLMFNPVAAFPTDETTNLYFDGAVYANSGILEKGQSWDVTFRTEGSFAFLCILHPGMTASVKVVDDDTDASAPAALEVEAQLRLIDAIEAGEKSANSVTPGKTVAANGTTTWEVLNAPSAGQSDVMRFIPQRLQVNAGDTVLWKNETPVPHTVTFGGAPELVLPEPQAGGPPNLVINPEVLFPVKPSQSFAGSGYVNSGFLGVGPEATGGSSFSLTFTKAGTYLYVCVLHADQGMAGVVEVVGESAGGTISPPSTGDAGLAAPRDGSAVWAAAAMAAPFGLILLLAARKAIAGRS